MCVSVAVVQGSLACMLVIRQAFPFNFCHNVSNICPLKRLIAVAYFSVPLAVTAF